MGGTLKAVAFDMDGTLYPNYRLYLRLLPRFFLHPAFYNAFIKVRRELHAADNGNFSQAGSFYDRQISLMAKLLRENNEKIGEKLERLVYSDMEKLFSGMELFPHVKETLVTFRKAGLKLGLLSDFPPEEKVSLLGLDGYFDAIVSSEETGALKPSGIPFAALAGSLALSPKEILYVGNHIHFDAEGSKSAGFNSALIKRSMLSTGRVPKNSASKADFVFRDYRQLREYVLG